MTRKNQQNQSLIWVYPPNNWHADSNKTFVYGHADPYSKLFVSSDEYLVPERIKIFPNGNFAKNIKLPNLINNIKLIQIINNKRKVLSRKIIINNHKISNLRKDAYIKEAKKSKIKSFKSPIIVIDPGHGGNEHGTHSPKGVPESYFNLQIAKALLTELKKITNNVYITREKDKFLPLQERVQFAKKKKCNILISIHHNALPDSEDPLKHSGIGIYYTNSFVKRLGTCLLKAITKESKIRSYGIFKRNFALTRPSFCHAVLIECGFLIHPVESEYITKPETQKKIVQGIIKGLKASKLLK
jgi:N-acetylmuramoyl-L-alanine amidase